MEEIHNKFEDAAARTTSAGRKESVKRKVLREHTRQARRVQGGGRHDAARKGGKKTKKLCVNFTGDREEWKEELTRRSADIYDTEREVGITVDSCNQRALTGWKML